MKSYPLDFRQKLIDVYEAEHLSIRVLAKRFAVSPDMVRRLLKQYKETGDIRPKKCGTRRKSLLSQHREVVLALVEQHPDWTLCQYSEYLTDILKVNISVRMMEIFLAKENITLKKKSIGVRKLYQKQCKKSE